MNRRISETNGDLKGGFRAESNYKKLGFLFFLCIFSLSFSAFAENEWLTNLEKGLLKGKADGKRVLCYFSATWCGWCSKMSEEVFEKKEFQEYAGKNFVLVTLDADQNREIVDKFKVEGFPTILIFDTEGKVLDQVVGYKLLDSTLEALKYTEGKFKPRPPAVASETKTNFSPKK